MWTRVDNRFTTLDKLEEEKLNKILKNEEQTHLITLWYHEELLSPRYLVMELT